MSINLKQKKNIKPHIDGMQKVSSIDWSEDNKLAVSCADRVIYLFDSNLECKDRVPTKPADKTYKSYIVRAVAFSPCSTKIAVAQSDNIVFVYKIGAELPCSKKTICNKFLQTSSVTCMTWPRNSPDKLFIGCADGKLLAGLLKAGQRSDTLFSSNSQVVAVAGIPNTSQVVSGHYDNTVHIVNYDNLSVSKLVTHTSIPFCMSAGRHLAVSGLDLKVTFQDLQGKLINKIDQSKDTSVKEFSGCQQSPSGDSVVFLNFNKFQLFQYSMNKGVYEESVVKNIQDQYSVTAACWKLDGSQVTIGSLCGSVDAYDICMRKLRYKNKFEVNQVAQSQILLKRITDDKSISLKSSVGNDIYKFKTFMDQQVVCWCKDYLLLGDIELGKTSELNWNGSGKEKFDFSNHGIVMIQNAGELTFVQQGINEPIGFCRTEQISPHLISARLSDDPKKPNIVAYLLDTKTIIVQDLNKNLNMAQINHDQTLDFLELNSSGSKLIFRDKKKRLTISNIYTQSKTTLLNYCSYVQWVPLSDVVVAQNRGNLCVWYNIEDPDKVVIYNIANKGDVVGIERASGKTSVIVEDGSQNVYFELDEQMINFGYFLERKNLNKAVEILEKAENANQSYENEANWKSLGKVALEEKNLVVAERCFAAIGDVAKLRQVKSMKKIALAHNRDTGKEGNESYIVQAKLSMVEKKQHKAEAVLLQNNDANAAMEMQQTLKRWDESIRIAVKQNVPNVGELKRRYFDWLLMSNQEEKAAELREKEGEYFEAINLQLKAGFPARAVNLIINYNVTYQTDIIEKVANALIQANMYEKAGEFFEKLNIANKALEQYTKGNAFKKAVELAKKSFPSEIVKLEEKWGDHLMSMKQTESAVSHQIDASASKKAIEAAISSRQWKVALDLLANQPSEVSRPYIKQIAKFQAESKQFAQAEKLFFEARCTQEAFEMQINHKKQDNAYEFATRNLPKNEIVSLYCKNAQKFEQEKRYKEAEQLYLKVKEIDQAISMYRNAKKWDEMIKLAQQYRPDILKEVYGHIAPIYQNEGNQLKAEQCYIDGGLWMNAVEMQKQNSIWDEALRVVKTHGSSKEVNEFAKNWAVSMGKDKGIKLLMKLGLTESAIDQLLDLKDFEEAYTLAGMNAKHKVGDVHLKHAQKLEDDKKFKEAEDHYIKSGKPKEAIHMYEFQKDQAAALKIARRQDATLVSEILVNQAKWHIDRKELQEAENCLLQSKNQDKAINVYLEKKMFNDALRLAKMQNIERVGEINAILTRGAENTNDDKLRNASLFEEQQEWRKAINCQLSLTEEDVDNLDKLGEYYDHALNLTMQFEKDKVNNVVIEVVKKLKKLNRHEQAGEYQENFGQQEQAILSYMQASAQEKAKTCVGLVKNPEQKEKQRAMIEEKMRKNYKSNNDIDQLVNSGDVITGLDMLVKQGQYEQCLIIAQKNGMDVLSRQLFGLVNKLAQGGDQAGGLKQLIDQDVPPVQKQFKFYRDQSLEALNSGDKTVYKPLKDMLRKLAANIKSSGGNEKAIIEFERIQSVALLLSNRTECMEQKLYQIALKIAISQLRQVNQLQLDTAFQEAGYFAEKLKKTNWSYIFQQKFLDIVDAINDQDPDQLTMEQLEHTDIPNLTTVPLPKTLNVSTDKIEAVRNQVLQFVSSEATAEMKLESRVDENGSHIFEGSLRHPGSNTGSEECLVSGFPVLKQNQGQCSNCGKGYNKQDWNSQIGIFNKCPNCYAIHKVLY